MIPEPQVFSQKVCYTPLVFERVNKKLKIDFSIAEIKSMVQNIINDSTTEITKTGKNYYLLNKQTELVINSYNYRLITVNRKK